MLKTQISSLKFEYIYILYNPQNVSNLSVHVITVCMCVLMCHVDSNTLSMLVHVQANICA